MGSNSAEDKFCLRWNDFHSNVSSSFRDLRIKNLFFDVSLAIDPNHPDASVPVEIVPAHKMVLAACSPFFEGLLSLPQMAQNPVIYLRGVGKTDLQHILDFMYEGEVNVKQEEINTFLVVAEDLKIKGLTQNEGPKPKRLKRDSPTSENGTKGHSGSNPTKKKPGPRPKSTSHGETHEDEVMEVSQTLKFEPSTSGQGQESGTSQQSFTEDGGQGQPEYEEEEFGQFDSSDGMAGYSEGDSSMGAAEGGKDLDELIRNHSTESNSGFLCLLCGRVVVHRSSMRRHFKDSHMPKEVFFKCPACPNRTYATKNSFGSHIFKMHPEYRGMEMDKCAVRQYNA